jgi:hypothetical protein
MQTVMAGSWMGVLVVAADPELSPARFLAFFAGDYLVLKQHGPSNGFSYRKNTLLMVRWRLHSLALLDAAGARNIRADCRGPPPRLL